MGSQRPGAWTGFLVTSDGTSVYKSVMKEQWTKTQSKVRELAQHVGLSDDRSSLEGDLSASPYGEPPRYLIQFKIMEKFVGFLVYVVGTYTIFVPYLKGIYLTLNSWRPGRIADGWPLPGFERDLLEIVKDDLVPPIWVKIVLQLKSDLKALLKLTDYDEPPKLPICSSCLQTTYVIEKS